MEEVNNVRAKTLRGATGAAGGERGLEIGAGHVILHHPVQYIWLLFRGSCIEAMSSLHVLSPDLCVLGAPDNPICVYLLSASIQFTINSPLFTYQTKDLTLLNGLLHSESK